MGNYRFRMSDMFPNAWFYKLNDVKKTNPPSSMSTKQQTYPKSTTQQQKPLKPGRVSYHIPNTISTTSTNITVENNFPNSPVNRKASDTKFLTNPARKIKPGRSGISIPKPCHRVLTSSVSFGCGCCSTLKTRWKGEELPLLNHPLIPDSQISRRSCSNDDNENDSFPVPCFDDKPIISSVSITSSPTDINNGRHDFPFVPPPILTKPITKKQQRKSNIPLKSEGFNSSPRRRRLSAGIHRLKTRANSPRLVTNKRTPTRSRKSKGLLSDSYVVVKTSSDPKRDFRDSMMEMIIENRITAVKDLVELLSCYLSLNSDEYHDVIVKVFKQIWFYLSQIVSISDDRSCRLTSCLDSRWM